MAWKEQRPTRWLLHKLQEEIVLRQEGLGDGTGLGDMAQMALQVGTIQGLKLAIFCEPAFDEENEK